MVIDAADIARAYAAYVEEISGGASPSETLN